MLLNFIKKPFVIVITLFVICIISFIGIYFCNNKENDSKSIVLNDITQELSQENNVTLVEEIFTVEIKGAVVNPGVYKVKRDSRVIDVVNLAGGFIENANTRYINLSKKVNDEMSIVIYTNEEISSYKQNNLIIIEEPCECDVTNDACLNEITDNNLVSINEATFDELINIPGIGESKANAILEYRKENKFNKLEDILNVKGIGQSLFDAIKEYIKI